MQRRTSIRNFVYHFLIILFVTLIALVLFLLFLYLKDQYFPSKDNVSKRPLFGFYIIVSGSMEPTIHVNDAVFIVRKDHDDYQINDIITFMPEAENYKGMTVTHRIIKKNTVDDYYSLYTTKGDNNTNEDVGKISTNGIYGKVLFVIPKVGFIKDIIVHPLTLVISLLLLFVILFVLFGRKKRILS